MAKKAKKEEVFDHFNNADLDATGFEDINNQTKALPFIRLLQDLSAQVKKNKPEYVEGAEAGMLINTVSEKLYESPLKIIIGKFERYYVEWKPNRGNFVASHLPEDVEGGGMPQLVRDEKFKLIDPATGNSFVDTYIYYVVLPDYLEEGVCILTLSASGIKEAKKLNRNLTSTVLPGTTRKALPYFMIWNLNVVEMSNDQGDWWGLKFRFDSFVDQDQLSCIVKERKELPNKTLDLKMLSDQREDDSDKKADDVAY